MTEQGAQDPRWAKRWGMAGLTLDLSMVGLIVINLLWIIFDSMWVVPQLRTALGWVLPQAWLQGYGSIHENFFAIDLVFVSIFLAEFVLRWAEAVWNKRHSVWFVYPIVHWYDILGCIPVGGLRWLRVLRVFAILGRLQRLGFIDYTTWLPYRWAVGIYDVIMEEVSDRVVVRVLGGVQDELKAASGLERRIVDEVILPRRETLMAALSRRISNIGQSTYQDSRADLHAFITRTVSKSVHENREVKIINGIPLLGGPVGGLLDHAITDIVCRVIDELVAKLGTQEFSALFDEIGQSLFEALREATASQGDEPAESQIMLAIHDVLEVVKQQVSQRRWLDRLAESSP